jgi:hypothetical protein
MSLAALSPLATRFAQQAGAKPNNGRKPNKAVQKASGFTDSCTFFGGVTTVTAVKPGKSVTVSCSRKGGSTITCTFTNKSQKCNEKAMTHPLPGDVPNTPLEPSGGNLTPLDGEVPDPRQR